MQQKTYLPVKALMSAQALVKHCTSDFMMTKHNFTHNK